MNDQFILHRIIVLWRALLVGLELEFLFCYLTLYSVCMGFFIFVRKSCSRAVTFLILSNKVMFMIKKNMITHNPYYI